MWSVSLRVFHPNKNRQHKWNEHVLVMDVCFDCFSERYRVFAVGFKLFRSISRQAGRLPGVVDEACQATQSEVLLCLSKAACSVAFSSFTSAGIRRGRRIEKKTNGPQ